MSFGGKKNIYVCEVCFGHVVTVDLVKGVTPFLIGCKATEGCKGLMQSSMYRVYDQRMAPAYEWYSPDARERGMLSAASLDHVERGGLLLREATQS